VSVGEKLKLKMDEPLKDGGFWVPVYFDGKDYKQLSTRSESLIVGDGVELISFIVGGFNDLEVGSVWMLIE
jgi:hypothetical protein